MVCSSWLSNVVVIRLSKCGQHVYKGLWLRTQIAYQRRKDTSPHSELKLANAGCFICAPNRPENMARYSFLVAAAAVVGCAAFAPARSPLALSTRRTAPKAGRRPRCLRRASRT